jgi:NAD-dependent oxidoreductase involved in siderophore biosynthesis
MIKLLVIGVWVCAVTLASSYAVVLWKSPHAHSKEADKHIQARETIKIRMLSVPVIHQGEHQGYVVAQFMVTADAALAKRYATRAEMIIADEAFKTIYGEEDIDFRKLRKQDLAKITGKIVENVNKRVGSHFVEDAFIHELNYVTKAEIRNGQKKS